MDGGLEGAGVGGTTMMLSPEDTILFLLFIIGVVVWGIWAYREIGRDNDSW